MRLRYTIQAARELDEALNDIAESSPGGAKRVQTRIREAIDTLLHYPLSGRPTRHPRLQRVVATPYPYLIFYEANDDEVVIVGVRHAARAPSTMPSAG